TRQARSNLMAAYDAIIAQHIKQTHNVNKSQRDTPLYGVGQLVYSSTKNLSIPKGRARKLALEACLSFLINKREKTCKEGIIFI
ncbi:MAG TPA: hypothetical protein VGO47_13270, partial [Chlamydiales bacterium]|nr:hypothetical protein [Chlamydiales bacterium]